MIQVKQGQASIISEKLREFPESSGSFHKSSPEFIDGARIRFVSENEGEKMGRELGEAALRTMGGNPLGAVGYPLMRLAERLLNSFNKVSQASVKSVDKMKCANWYTSECIKHHLIPGTKSSFDAVRVEAQAHLRRFGKFPWQ